MAAGGLTGDRSHAVAHNGVPAQPHGLAQVIWAAVQGEAVVRVGAAAALSVPKPAARRRIGLQAKKGGYRRNETMLGA